MEVLMWIIARLKEPSTWAGFAALFAAVGLSGEMTAAISAVGVAAAGLVSVFLAEKSAAE